MQRGMVYWINLGPTRPPEFGKKRPGLIISNTLQNELLDSLIVVPLSTQPGEIWPLRLACGRMAGQASYAVLPGLRQVSRKRIIEPIGMLSSGFIEKLDRALDLYLKD